MNKKANRWTVERKKSQCSPKQRVLLYMRLYYVLMATTFSLWKIKKIPKVSKTKKMVYFERINPLAGQEAQLSEKMR